MDEEIRIEYDDDALAIMDKVNAALESKGLMFQDDEQDYDGFIIYNLVEIDDDEDEE